MLIDDVAYSLQPDISSCMYMQCTSSCKNAFGVYKKARPSEVKLYLEGMHEQIGNEI